MFTAQKRFGNDPSEIVRTKTWKDPLRWQRLAESDGKVEAVFTCSWSDWFHDEADTWRDEAWDIVRSCPNLIFQILTKRPESVLEKLPHDWGSGYANVWLGTSIESSDYLWRVEELRKIPSAIRFLSAEPLLGPLTDISLEAIDWLIVGGESGPGYRPMDHEWVRELRDIAVNRGTAFFFKQSAAPRTEMGTQLDGREWREFPVALDCA